MPSQPTSWIARQTYLCFAPQALMVIGGAVLAVMVVTDPREPIPTEAPELCERTTGLPYHPPGARPVVPRYDADCPPGWRPMIDQARAARMAENNSR